MSQESPLEFGVFVQPWGRHASPEYFRRTAAAAEDGGFDVLWAGDHLTFQADMPNVHPATESGEPPIDYTVDQPCFDVFGTLTYLAGLTDTVELGTNICVVPYRHPVALAKQILTLDSVTDGGFRFGAGAGWLPTEFEVLDVPFEERGSRVDEFLDLLEVVAEDARVSFDGPHHSFPTTGFYPRPTNETGPPVLIGGWSGATFRRIGEFGDGWTIPQVSPQYVEDGKERLLNAWTDFEREGDPEIIVMYDCDIGGDPDDGLLSGSPDSVAESVAEFADAGATHFVLDVDNHDVDERVRQVELFGDEILPRFS